jgi:amidase
MDPIRLEALETVERLKRRELSPLDLIDAAERRILAVDPLVNALPTRCFERARARAKTIAAQPDAGKRSGWLAGLPVVIKDLNDVAGVRTTMGSPIFADRVASRSDVLVETLEANGAVVIAKSNTPEFGAGANTFNPVFGKTLNPWDTRMTCGGSSGGAAVALATGMAWLAHGSDLGGSLRTPAGFCSVVGLRPSPGRVAHGSAAPAVPPGLAFENLFVDGPMGRSVADVALMLDAMAGERIEDPLSLPTPVRPFLASAKAPVVPKRVALSPDLGIWPLDPEVRAVVEAAASRLEKLGARVERASPDFSKASSTFHVLRAALFAGMIQPLLERHRDRLKPDVVWNIEKGLALSSADIGQAQRDRSRLYHDVVEFFGRYDVLLAATAIVPPFPVDRRYVERVGDHVFENYVDWVGITYVISLTACPALSLPAGFTQGGLPVGVQMISRPRGEDQLLGYAAALEADLGLNRLLPIDPRPEGRV